MRTFRSVTLAGLFAAAALIVPTNAFAQGFGVEAGITRATLKADSATDLIKGRTGVMGGIWFGGNRSGRVEIQIGDHDARSCGGETLGDCTAYAARGAGDERNPVFQVHALLLALDCDASQLWPRHPCDDSARRRHRRPSEAHACSQSRFKYKPLPAPSAPESSASPR